MNIICDWRAFEIGDRIGNQRRQALRGGTPLKLIIMCLSIGFSRALVASRGRGYPVTKEILRTLTIEPRRQESVTAC
jgi:hypothetical protein